MRHKFSEPGDGVSSDAGKISLSQVNESTPARGQQATKRRTTAAVYRPDPGRRTRNRCGQPPRCGSRVRRRCCRFRDPHRHNSGLARSSSSVCIAPAVPWNVAPSSRSRKWAAFTIVMKGSTRRPAPQIRPAGAYMTDRISAKHRAWPLVFSLISSRITLKLFTDHVK